MSDILGRAKDICDAASICIYGQPLCLQHFFLSFLFFFFPFIFRERIENEKRVYNMIGGPKSAVSHSQSASLLLCYATTYKTSQCLSFYCPALCI